MDWKIEHLHNIGCILITTSGQFSLEDQQSMFDELCSHHARSPCLPLLFDNRRIVMGGSSVEVMRESVAIMLRFMKSQDIKRVAGLVDAGLNFGVGRQFETLVEISGGDGFRLFKDEGLAIRWLKGEVD